MTSIFSLTRSDRGSLLRRVGVTLLALALYRVGQWTPLPGIDLAALSQTTALDMTGGTRTATSVMALGIIPLLTALVLSELAMCLSPRLRRWAQTPRGGGQMRFWAVAAAMLLATVQAYGVAVAIEAVPSMVTVSHTQFFAGVAASFIGATAVIIWLADWITRKGIGHGFWVIFAAGHAETFFQPLVLQLPLLAMGAMTAQHFLMSVGTSFAVLALAVAAATALVKAGPSLSTPRELVWTPLVGPMAVNLLLSALLVVQYLLMPQTDSSSLERGALDLIIPLLALSVAATVLLRRKSFLPPRERVDVAAAVPAIALLVVFVTANLVFPLAQNALLLAAVGLMILPSNRTATDGAAATPPDAPPETPLAR